MLWHETKWFCQRGWRGYSDLEVMSGLNYYLCAMLPDALREAVDYRRPAQRDWEQWHRRVECMVDGLEAAQEVMDRAETFEQEEQLVRRFKRGWLLMGRWYWWL
jgi:hypothetical protein